jgi:spermidine synthase
MPRKSATALALLVAISAFFSSVAAGEKDAKADRIGVVEQDIHSEYSHIRLRKEGSIRALLFVNDKGDEAIESVVDLQEPWELLVDYTRYMFLSYAHRPEQSKALIVGLGGGAMAHFLEHYDPSLQVDIVEIDPVVINLAERYFRVRQTSRIRIIKADALQYLADTQAQYDVIYMDAFLKPSPDTDPNGIPLALKTDRFYRQIQQRLRPDGLAVFNLNPHEGNRNDIAAIASAFPQTYAYKIQDNLGYVVAASTSPQRLPKSTIVKQAEAADKRFRASFSLKKLAGALQN